MSFTGHGWRSGQASDAPTGSASTATVTSLNPATGPRSARVITLIVTGTGYASGDVIYANNVPLPTTFTDTTHLQTTAFNSMPDSGAVGNIPVGVRKPGQVLSNTVNFAAT